jgi:transcriptional regulator with XRE-family HTH domain
MGIGDEVRRLRLDRQLSIGALARRAGMTTTGVSLVERGIRSPTSETVEKLAHALNVKPGELYPKAVSPSRSRRRVEEEALLEAPGVRAWLGDHGAALLLMSDAKFLEHINAAVSDPFDVAEIIIRLRDERDDIRNALRGTTRGMPEALMPAGAEGATREEKGFDAHRRRRALEAWARYQAFRRYIDLVNLGNRLIAVETEDLEVPALTESTKT